MLAFDHVVIATGNLEDAASRLWDEQGLATMAGGRHPGHGTANRIAPLGPDYIELMAVVDRDEAEASPLGRFVAAFVAEGGGLMALCLRTRDITTVTTRLGIEPLHMTRTRTDGRELSWHIAGLEEALGQQRLPFFIEWDVAEDDHPGRTVVEHREEPSGISWVELAGDKDVIAHRLGDGAPNIRVVPGRPGILAVGIQTRGGEIRL